MQIGPGSFLHWAKTHRRARYELTMSGVPPVGGADFGAEIGGVKLVVDHAYGDPELRRLIGARYGVSPDEVLPVTGASSANFVALACAVPGGGRILIESPGYEPVSRAAGVLGLTVETVARDTGPTFAPDLGQVERGLARGARGVVLSDLHNPSGCACAEEDLAQAAGMCEAHGAYLIVDEVYRDFAHLNGDRRLESCRNLGSHVITTGSLTKAYGFGGLRAGWVLADPSVIDRARDVFDGMCVDLPAPSSDLAIRILSDIERFADRTRCLYRESFPVYDQWVRSRDELMSYPNHGALFGYCKLPTGWSADGFNAHLLERYDTVVVPGAFFGAPDHIRIGFGLPASELSEALSRIGEALESYR